MRVNCQPRNVGAYPNILTTLHMARGEVVVSISDDDVAVIEPLLRYLKRMLEDPALVMIQAPWLLTDETQEHAVIGQFYELEGETRLPRGGYLAALAFIIENRVFPECCLLRRSALNSIAGPVPQFTYSYFAMIGHALGQGDVLFCPEPHIAATAISLRGHVGNDEAMGAWDTYRGGLELLASYARQASPGTLGDANAIGGPILAFVCERMAVAARLQAHAENWSNAYQLLRRLHAYGLSPPIDVPTTDVAVLAAVETALLECSQLGATTIVAGDSIPDSVLGRLRPIEGVRVIRPDEVAVGDGRRAYFQVGEASDPSMREQDFGLDMTPVMNRFPPLPA